MDKSIQEIIGGYDAQDKFVNALQHSKVDPYSPTRDSMDSSYSLKRETIREGNHVLNLGKSTMRDAVAIRDEIVSLMSEALADPESHCASLNSFLSRIFEKLTTLPKGYVINVSGDESNVALRHDPNQVDEGIRSTIERALAKEQLLEIIYEKKLGGELSTKRIRVKELKDWGVRARTVQGDRSYNWDKIKSAMIVSDKSRKAKKEPTHLFAISINRTLTEELKANESEETVSIYHRVSLHLVNDNLVLIDLHRDSMSKLRDPWQI